MKEKSKYMGPEVPDRIYVYGQDALPESRMEEDAEAKKEIDEDVCVLFRSDVYS